MRPSPDRHQEKARVRLALLRAALSLSAEHGFNSLGLREVSREAGIAPTSFYRHFADMTELGRAIIDELAGPKLNALAKAAAAAFKAGNDGALLLIEQLQQASAEDPALMHFILGARFGAVDEFRERVRSALSELSSAALFVSRSHIDAVLADAASSALLVACERPLDPGERLSLRRALGQLARGLSEGDGRD